jgi:hypothetical protein
MPHDGPLSAGAGLARSACARVATIACTFALAGCSGGGGSGATTATDLATEGYLFGFPLVVTERTLQTFGAALGVNRPFAQQARSNATTRVVVAPNTDTLYAIAVIDLRPGPLLLTLPDIVDRYHTFQFMDAWTESFAYLGTRTTGGRGGTWLLAPPGWEGDAPPNAERIDFPTPQGFMLGRVLVEGDAEVPAVTALTARIAIAPLDPAAPPPPPLGAPAGPPAQTGTNGLAFWDELGDALAVNPPTTEAQRALLEQLADLGIGPGRRPSTEVTDPDVLAALAAAVDAGNERIDGAFDEVQVVNGWRYATDIGVYGDDLVTRAAIARNGWGANVPAEAVYPTASIDSDGAPLDGTHRYRIRFEADRLPPVDAFWSVTLYGPDRFFVENPLRRYALGDRSPGLEYGADGSLEILVQSAPTEERQANWLPAPAGPFSLMLRLYLPKQEVVEGAWEPPRIERID